jgi:hypothetical protein
MASTIFTGLFVRMPMNDSTGMYAVCTQCLVWRQVAVNIVCTWVPLLAAPSFIIAHLGSDALSLSRQRVRMLSTGPWQHRALATVLVTRDTLWPFVRRYAVQVTVAQIALAYACVLWQLRLRDIATRALYTSPELFAEQFTSAQKGMTMGEWAVAGWHWIKNKFTLQKHPPPRAPPLHDSATTDRE